MQRIILGISGASGMPLAHTMLLCLRTVPELEIHLIVSGGARRVLQTECAMPLGELLDCAHVVHEISDMAAAPSSGSWLHGGMIVCPCSMSSLASIASGAGINLIHRAADVTLKERRPLVLVPRETPLNLIHLRNMQTICEAGGIIMPFSPAFYTKEVALAALMRHFTGRVLDQMGIAHNLCIRWQGEEGQ